MRVAFLSSPYGTPRHRCENPSEQLRGQGVEAVVLEGEAPSLAGYSHAVLNRVPLDQALAARIAEARAGGTRVLFDVDDLIYDPELLAGMEFLAARPAPERERVLAAVAGIARTVEACGAGLCATPALRRDLEGRGRRARVAPNGVSDALVRISAEAAAARGRERGVLRIGFPGGHGGHTLNLALVEDALLMVLDREPAARLVLIGWTFLTPRLLARADRVDVLPYQDWRRLPFELARLDVCIAPLAANAFNGCKSDVKFLEAALVGVPLVASPVGQLGETIRHGVTGLLADGTEEWVEALSSLLEDPRRGEGLAAAASDEVLRHRTSAALGPALVEALSALS